MGNLSKIGKSELAPIEIYKTPDQTFYGQELELKKELKKSEVDFIESINYRLIREINRKDLLDQVFIVVSNNLRALGSRMVAEDQLLLVNDFVEEISNEFSNLTIKEFELIVKNGIRKKYDSEKVQTVGLSVVNFNYWAKKYLEYKFKMNQEISNKINKEKLNSEPAVKVNLESTLDILRQDYLLAQKQYKELNPEHQSWENYWLGKGCQISASYLAEKFIEYKKITRQEIEKEYDELIGLGYTTLQARMESERRIICKLALELASAKQKSDERKKS